MILFFMYMYLHVLIFAADVPGVKQKKNKKLNYKISR